MRHHWLCISIWFLLLSSLSIGQAHAEWQSLYYRDHPLVGKVFSTAEKAWISTQQLHAQIQNEQFILLGETHTNPDHHIGQADIIENWLSNQTKNKSERKPASALVFEMLTYDDWVGFKLPNLEVDELTAKLEEVSSRWDWPLYTPILEMQIKYQLPMVGANLSKAQLDEYSSEGTCEISREGENIEFCHALNAQQKALTKQLIYDAHCGYLPLEHTTPLLNTQIAKDASFALSLTNIGKTHNAALIAGAVHIRKDIGVPVHLRRMGEKSVSIAFLSVSPGKMEVGDYFDQADSSQQFDYIYFTPNERNQDPCVEFAEQLKKMKKTTK